MKMRKWLLPMVVTIIATSCAAPTYVPCPQKKYTHTQNTGTFVVQNMDEMGQVTTNSLTVHYEGFDVMYNVTKNLVVTFVIQNNTNKSLLIDKSKSYVLYDGYATQLFKDVRSSRSTTFNNVQDAINNVQTNESGVLMTIPPYSKWEIPLQETNLSPIKKLPVFGQEGDHSLTVFDNEGVTEFVIPYSYDYSMAKWKTSRNRIYVGRVETAIVNNYDDNDSRLIDGNRYAILSKGTITNYEEIAAVKRQNEEIFKKHVRGERIGKLIFGTLTLPILFISIPVLIDVGADCAYPGHQPPHCF